MSRLIGVCGALLVWCGGAAADPATSTPPGADAVSAPPVKEITIDPNAKEPVCRRAAPTGSRIAKERCETPAVAASSAEREQLRRDLDEMRTRAAMREQARAAAQLEALRRAGL
jgi:hypothetical protein